MKCCWQLKAFSVQRSAFGVRSSAFGAGVERGAGRRSEFRVQRRSAAFGVQGSAVDAALFCRVLAADRFTSIAARKC
jgi:hypothetical protein